MSKKASGVLFLFLATIAILLSLFTTSEKTATRLLLLAALLLFTTGIRNIRSKSPEK